MGKVRMQYSMASTNPALVAKVTLTALQIEAVAGFIWLACAARVGADAAHLAGAPHLLTPRGGKSHTNPTTN